MSIIKGLVGSFVGKKAGESAIDEKRERRNQERHWKKMMEKNPLNRHLWMTEEYYDGKLPGKGYAGYAFFDDEQALQYMAKSTRERDRTITIVYDGDKNIIAVLAEITIRSGLLDRSSNHNDIHIGIKIGGEIVGEIRNADLTKKGYLTMTPVNWNAVHNGSFSTRIVDSNNQEKAEITQKVFSRGCVTFLDCSPNIDDLWIVLYALGMEIYEQHDDKKLTRR